MDSANTKTKVKKFQKSLVVVLLIVSAFFGGWYLGKRGYVFEVRKNPPEIEVINRAPTNQEIDFALFWKVWNILRKEYLLRPVDGQKMFYGAVKGMVQSLGDPYTSFLPPSLNESVTNALNGTYEGIGAELGMEGGQLMVVAPLDGSPAKKVGVRSGDKIIKIEDESTASITITEAVSKIRGPAGSVIALTLQRNGKEPFVVRIKRGEIVLKSVSWDDKKDGIAYIRISRFGGETNKGWDTVASEVNVNMSSLDAIILDVRGNPGGYLMSAVHIAGEFMNDKTVVYQESATGDMVPLETQRLGNFQRLPVFVLIDKGSASASEILAGALREHSEAVLVGTTSFGKGTIQDARDFNDGSGLHLTVAKWLMPNKEWVHKKGIKPDVTVEYNIEEPDVDEQLQKAIELAKSGVTSPVDLQD